MATYMAPVATTEGRRAGGRDPGLAALVDRQR
jgi:hypothetical protein